MDISKKEELSETEIINQYRLGELADVFISDNCFYMPIRITGTGETLRAFNGENGEIEFLIEDRTKHLFFSKNNLEQCGRLPILLYHPKDKNGGMVSFHNKDSWKQIIGQTVYAYIQGDEIWAIGRIYDLNILNMINKKIFSTSPAVISKCVIMDDNLSREIPLEINHIAFVEKGHWDSKSPKAFECEKILIKEDALEERPIVGNEKVKEAVIEQTKDSDIVEVKNDEDVVVTHEVKPIADTQVIDEDLPILDNEKIEVKETKKDNATKVVKEKTKDDATKVVKEKTKDDDDVITEEIVEVEDEEIVEIEDDDDVITEEIVEVEDDDDVITEEIVEVEDDDDGITEEVVEIEDDDDGIDTEIIVSDEVTDDDRARDKLVDSLNEICDSAHSSLNVKMPYVNGRETSLSVANKFINLNRHLVDKKFQKIINGKIDNMNAELCKDFIRNIKSRISEANIAKGKLATGFVPTRLGYKVDSDF